MMTINQISAYIQHGEISDGEIETLISMYLGERFINRTNAEGIIENFDVLEAMELARKFLAIGQLMTKK